MLGPSSRFPAILSLAAAALGLIFSSVSTFDYGQHLDRRLHDLHCSVIPGAPATSAAEACRTAMYSPYAAVLRDQYWGGIPISLFAIGAFAFLGGFALYLVVSGSGASRKAVGFFAGVGVTPLLVSIGMFVISATKLGTFCKTCVGIYSASFLLAAGALLGLIQLRRSGPGSPPDAGSGSPGDDGVRAAGSWAIPVAWLPSLGAITLVPALVYASAVPDHRPYLDKCGTIKKEATQAEQLLRFTGPRPVRKALFFEDPLCPTCKAFHQRLQVEGVLERLDAEVVLFPLDSECNWMLSSALHPGACVVAKAVLCGGDRARAVLEWAYEEQDVVARAGKAGVPTVKALLEKRWGADLVKCVDAKETGVRLNKHLHFASDNSIPVSTPQVYIGKQRLCDEDTDMGLRYTLRHLAPEVLQ